MLRYKTKYTGSTKKKQPCAFNPISQLLPNRFSSTRARWNGYITGFNLRPGRSKSDYPKPSNSKKCEKYGFSKITKEYIEFTVNYRQALVN